METALVKSWHRLIGEYTVSVQQLPDGSWLASTGLKGCLDPWGSTVKQETFETAVDAFRWVGYPADQTIGGIYFPCPIAV